MRKITLTDEYLLNYIDQMVKAKTPTGQWEEDIVDDGMGFPKIRYVCPFCHEEGKNTRFCPNCGARLGE